MARNGSGIYSLPADSGLVPKDPHTQTWNRAALADIATALTGSVAADGQTVLSGNLDLGGKNIIDLGYGSSKNHAAAYGQVARPGCLLLRTSAQTITSGVQTAVPWQVSAYDNASLWALTPNPTRITIPTGITLATFAAAYFNSAFTAVGSLWPLYFFILKGTNSFDGAPVFASLIDEGSTMHGMTITTPWIPVSAGDYFEVYLYQVSTVNQTFCGDADTRMRTWFACEVMEG